MDKPARAPAVRGRNPRDIRSASRRLPILAAVPLLAACGTGALAEAEGRRLEVDDAARLIAEHSTLPGDSQVVRVVAELWVDYTLLALHLDADTTLATLDVEPVIEQPRFDLMMSALRDHVLEVDTVVGDEELTERFAAELPGARATASQILLAFPRAATTRQRDSVLAFAHSLKNQLDTDGDFATLAERFSADPGSGRRGGSMGTFSRGQMLAPIDQAIFALGPGELSDPVETTLGYHLLRLDSLEVPELSEVADEFRQRILLERFGAAEAAYIMQLDSVAGLAIADGSVEIARALLDAVPSRLSGGAARRPLLTWTGGAYTTGDLMELLLGSPEGFAESVAAAGDEELEAALLRLGREELLVEEARARDLEPAESVIDSLAADARRVIRERIAVIGLVSRANASPADPPVQEAGDSAVAGAGDPVAMGPEALVEAALIRVISGEQEIFPLGAVAFLLRSQGDWRVHEGRIGTVLGRIREIQSS
ncbi:MAG: peptidylprolyl isomerase [Gemmatimonadota bacterium]|nr:peptidylprolyl isomerase [Gemmatimonadota bacterium]